MRSTSRLSTLLYCVTASVFFSMASLPSAWAQKQTPSFLVQRYYDPKLPQMNGKAKEETQIWAAFCDNINPASQTDQKIQCVLKRQRCSEKSGSRDCPFLNRATFDADPYPLVLGVSRWNPTCVWIFDPMRYEYTPWCWD